MHQLALLLSSYSMRRMSRSWVGPKLRLIQTFCPNSGYRIVEVPQQRVWRLKMDAGWLSESLMVGRRVVVGTTDLVLRLCSEAWL